MLAASPLGQHITTRTRGIFQLVDNVIQAFSGIAHMLDTTFIASITSFNAIVSLIEQFTNLKRYLNNLLGIRQVQRTVKDQPAKSTTKCIAFLTATAIIPYFLSKFIKLILKHRQTEEKNSWIKQFLLQHQQPTSAAAKLFAVSMFAFAGEREGDLKVEKGEIVAVLDSDHLDTSTWDNNPQWVRCKTEKGTYGLLPTNFLKPIKTSVP